MDNYTQLTSLPEVITLKEAMSFLRLTRPTLARLRRKGKLPACRLGNKIYFTREDIEQFINRSKI